MSDTTLTADATDAELVMYEGEASHDETALDAAILALKTGRGSGITHSFVGTDEDTIDAVLAALSDTTPIADVLGKPIAVVNYIVQKAAIKQKDGTYNYAPRITLIDADDAAYNVTSDVVMRDLMVWLEMRGEPSTWTRPLTIRFERGGTGVNKFITGKVVKATAAKR